MDELTKHYKQYSPSANDWQEISEAGFRLMCALDMDNVENPVMLIDVIREATKRITSPQDNSNVALTAALADLDAARKALDFVLIRQAVSGKIICTRQLYPNQLRELNDMLEARKVTR